MLRTIRRYRDDPGNSFDFRRFAPFLSHDFVGIGAVGKGGGGGQERSGRVDDNLPGSSRAFKTCRIVILTAGNRLTIALM